MVTTNLRFQMSYNDYDSEDGDSNLGYSDNEYNSEDDEFLAFHDADIEAQVGKADNYRVSPKKLGLVFILVYTPC